MAILKTLPLDERIKAMQAEINAFIDARAAEVKKHMPDLPILVIRNTLIRGNCECRQYLHLKEQDDAEARKGAA